MTRFELKLALKALRAGFYCQLAPSLSINVAKNRAKSSHTRFYGRTYRVSKEHCRLELFRKRQIKTRTDLSVLIDSQGTQSNYFAPTKTLISQLKKRFLIWGEIHNQKKQPRDGSRPSNFNFASFEPLGPVYFGDDSVMPFVINSPPTTNQRTSVANAPFSPPSQPDSSHSSFFQRGVRFGMTNAPDTSPPLADSLPTRSRGTSREIV
jgi:hypothetical protein